MTKQELIRQNERLRKRYEKAFRPILSKALKDSYSSYSSSLRENGPNYVLGSHGNLIDPALTSVIREMYRQAGIARAAMTLRSLQRLPRVERKKGFIGFNAQWAEDILNYFRLNLFNKVVLPIMEITQEYIKKVISEGIMNGWTIDEMVARIERQDYINGRTERILRTEINRAINYGNELAAKSYEFKTQKRWLAVHDNRTRHPHLEADGQTVDIDSSFSVGGEKLFFPGDPEGSPENTINCRCVTEIVPVRNSAGRLLPKEPKPVRIRGRLREQLQEIIGDLTS